MKILFHIDPFDDSLVMVRDRLQKFLSFAQILNANGADCSLIIDQKHKNFIPSNCLIKIIEFQTIEVQWEWIGQYHLYALVDGIPSSVIEAAKKSYKNIDKNYDLIITNTPSLILRKIFGDVKILHYELGFINRPPFPIFHQLDPLGYSFRSLLSKYPLIYNPKKEIQDANLSDLRGAMLEKINWDNSKKIIDGIYYPLLSDGGWTAKIETNGLTRLQGLLTVSQKFSQRKIYVNEKPQSPLSTFEINEIKKLSNVILIENKDIFGFGSVLTKSINTTITSSPSMSLQSIFWGNTFIPTPMSTMYAWDNRLESKENVLASYINNYNFIDSKSLIKVIDVCIRGNLLI